MSAIRGRPGKQGGRSHPYPTLRKIYKGFTAHRNNAKRRGIAFNLSFEQWLGIWKKSGHLRKRGRGLNRYHMARFRDRGAYEVDNVEIILHQQNSRDYVPIAEHCAAKSRALKGRLKTVEHRAAISRSWKTRAPFTEETRLKMSRSAKIRSSYWPTPEHIAYMHRLRGGNSAATRRKISESNKGRVGGFTGKRHSEATKQWKRKHWKNQYSAAREDS